MPYSFTAKGFASLLQTKQDLLAKLRRHTDEYHQQRSTKTTLDLSGDGDISDHLETVRDMHQVEQQLAEVEHWRVNSVIVEPTTQIERLYIGNVAKIQRFADVEGTKKIGKPESYLVGGYRETDTTASPPVLSYDSPILANFIGKRADSNDLEPLHIGGRTQYLELLEISLPAAKPCAHLKVVGT